MTFSETVAPILYANCVTCHRPGEAAPFSLISYADARRKGKMIAEVTGSRYTPPWRAAHGYGEFADERRLTDAQIAALGEWVTQGMPEGDPRKVSFDEMGTVSLVMQALRAEDEPVLQRAMAARVQAAVGRGMANGTLKRYLDGRGGGQR